MLKYLSLFSLIWVCSISNAQPNDTASEFIKWITLLRNNTYEIKEFASGKKIIYKGVLSSNDPEIRNGRFYFYSESGAIAATGTYKEDIPFGQWIYFGDSQDTLKIIDYSVVWNFLEKEALNYSVDNEVLKKLDLKDKEFMYYDGTFFKADEMPCFNGGLADDMFSKYINENLIYPIYAASKGIEGTVKISFIIDSEGYLRNPVILNPQIPDLNIEAMRILTGSPRWTPGKQNGLPINFKFIWNFDFTASNELTLKPKHLPEYPEYPNNLKTGELFFIVEEMPTFNNGDPSSEFRKYIAMNIRYPEGAVKTGDTGRVILQFEIDPTGKLVNPIILKSAGPALDNEVLRIVNESPLWTPGKQRGKPVRVLLTFSVNFNVNQN